MSDRRLFLFINKSVRLKCDYRLGLFVEEMVIVEIKAIEQLLPVHNAQLVSFLRLAQYPVGLLINFNVQRLIEGVHRRVNHYQSESSLRPLRAPRSLR